MTAPPPELTGPFLHGQSPLQGQQQETQWQSVTETEKQVRQSAAKEIDRLERVINLAQRMLSIKAAPGFQQFEQSVEDLRTHAQNEMVGCTRGNEQLRILQGRCQALSSILALMRNTEHKIESLAQQLVAAKEKTATLIRPDGRVAPQPAVGGIL